MPWSNGVYTRSNGVFTGATVWTSDASVGTNITTNHHDTHDQDIATGLNNCVTVDGLNQIAANFVSTADGAYNLGSASFRWANGYFSGNVTVGGTVTINGAVATVGPSSAVSGNLASFNGTGGNILADSGFSAATLVVPTGTILEYAGASAPSGFLLANGQAVSRTTYATLYGICGTTYGVGDGSTTFNVPDRRGRVGAGYDPSNATGLLTGSTAQGASAAALGNSGGEQAHTQAGTEMVAHNHPASSSSSSSSVVTDPGHAHVAKFGNTPSGGSFPYTSTGAASGEVDVPTTATTTGVTVATTTTTTTTTSDTGGGNAFNVVQPTIILNYIIKT